MENHIIIYGFLAALFAASFSALGGLLIFIKKTYNRKQLDFVLNIAAGIMLASSMFTLLMPAAETVRQNGNNISGAFLISLAVCGGVGLIWILHEILPHEHQYMETQGSISPHSALLFVFAIAFHKFPEGLAVGVAYAGQNIFDPSAITVGISLQNIPEGLMVATSLVSINYSKLQAALYAALTGLVQPLGAIVGLFLTSFGQNLVPFGMALAGGTMLFVIINEVLPETYHEDEPKNSTTALLTGFILMTWISIALG